MTLVAIGGAEDKTGDMIIHQRILTEALSELSRVCIITTATSEPAETAALYLDLYSRLGVEDCEILHIDSRAMADSGEVVKSLLNADVVLFTGGDQLRLTHLLSGTRAIETIRRLYHGSNLVVAGTSAGAAALSSLMLYGGRGGSMGYDKGEIMMTSGLGFLDRSVIDTHFSERNRLSRLFNAVATNPAVLGIGLDEDTAIVMKKNSPMEVIGKGTVTFVDGSTISGSNILEIERGQRILCEGLNIDVLSFGGQYEPFLRRVKPPGGGDLNDL